MFRHIFILFLTVSDGSSPSRRPPPRQLTIQRRRLPLLLSSQRVPATKAVRQRVRKAKLTSYTRKSTRAKMTSEPSAQAQTPPAAETTNRNNNTDDMSELPQHLVEHVERVGMGMFMDGCKPKETEWIRVDYKFAQEEVQHLRAPSTSARARLGSLSSATSSGTASFASATSDPGWTDRSSSKR